MLLIKQDMLIINEKSGACDNYVIIYYRVSDHPNHTPGRIIGSSSAIHVSKISWLFYKGIRFSGLSCHYKYLKNILTLFSE